MPRLRAVRTKEEVAAIPADQPVLIDVGEEPATPAIEAKEEKKIEAPETPAPAEAPRVEPESPDDKEALLKQLSELRRAEKTRTENEQRYNAEINALRQRAEAAEAASKGYQSSELQAQYDGALSALAAAQSDREAARQAIKAARAAGDENAELEAASQYNSADYRINRWEEAKGGLEQQLEASKQAPPAPPRPSDPVEAAIVNLPDAAKTWLRAHPIYVTSMRHNAKISALHWDAKEAGHTDFSDDYFKYIEEALGLRQKDDNADDADDSPPRRTTVMSAPPSREAVSMSNGKPVSTRITLSPEQREAAKMAGVDEITYAKNLIELQKRKAAGYYER